MSNESCNKPLLQTIITMVDTLSHERNGYDTLITILSLLCLLSILNRLQPSPSTQNPILQSSQSPTATNPLQKILGDLTKNMDGSSGGGGGPSPDMLMSLLPLLNNPQVKSKLNPANISNILGLINNLGGSNTDKPEPPKSEKNEKKEKKESSTATTSPPLTEQPPQMNNTDTNDPDKKELSRSLNWKTNFQNGNEV